ncbi:hypothetical protein [Spiroplasma platyhelix]|uniref:Transmembrane protein n=1 Tax=Spiroplasma platyhelix PALS-1 TaxID=1276218 RepID=A0A846U596_9MOLU|nr:hypothetical protein [Spiroplasma platyhelix]MBE4704254.1 hypothetical protein [Spiroplasma platyhelix PALS-1]NKE38627.1 hypothetical protein [Spiroplasma platyhelix PALS-1]UJB28838.1 hypothetical protein SPLAT_v1c00710 [Spiroplasma platyhelix PALS-1]
MKSRITWFLFFYIILAIFICYDLAYLGVIWSNRDLLNLYNNGFEVSGPGKDLFNYSNSFAVYGLPTLGTLFSLFGLVAAVLSQSFILKSSTPKSKLIALSTSFIVLIIGFYFDFIGQLFYNEWNDTSVMITETGKSPVVANTFYSYWMSLADIWIVFAVFFVLFIASIVIIIKLYYLNIQWLKYDKKENAQELNLEITAPFPSNVEFDPNETQTITLTLDTDKLTPWKTPKKKDKIKKKKKTKK